MKTKTLHIINSVLIGFMIFLTISSLMPFLQSIIMLIKDFINGSEIDSTLVIFELIYLIIYAVLIPYFIFLIRSFYKSKIDNIFFRVAALIDISVIILIILYYIGIGIFQDSIKFTETEGWIALFIPIGFFCVAIPVSFFIFIKGYFKFKKNDNF